MKRSYTFFLFLALIAICKPVMAKSFDVSIDFRKEVVLSSKEYQLSDIAEIHTSNQKLRDYLGEMLVGESPKRGLTQRVGKNTVNRIIQAKFPNQDFNISWGSNHFVKVRKENQAISVSEYLNKSRNVLLNFLTERSDGETTFEVSALDADNSEITLDKGIISAQIYIKKGSRINKRMCVWIDFYVEHEFQKTLPLWFDVKAFRDVYEVARPMQKREQIALSDLELVKRDVASVYETIIRSDDLAVESILTVNKMPGQTLLSKDITNKPAVTRNQKVEVNVYGRGVHIKTYAHADTDAEIGEWVKLISDTGDHYHALVYKEGGANVF